MAAVIAPAPTPTPRRSAAPRPALRVVPGGADAARRRRRAPAVYRRRRIGAAVLAVVVALTLALAAVGAASLLDRPADAPAPGAAATPPGATGSTPGPAPSTGAPVPATDTAGYVVQPGDTVWAIARRLQPEGDVRPLVDRIADRTDGGALLVGQRIALDGLVG